jgi:integrase
MVITTLWRSSDFSSRNRFTTDDTPNSGVSNEAGEHRYNFHLLRHAAASLFIAHLKWPPKRTQTVMGHASMTSMVTCLKASRPTVRT